jgi:hypothetical protein
MPRSSASLVPMTGASSRRLCRLFVLAGCLSIPRHRTRFAPLGLVDRATERAGGKATAGEVSFVA